MEKYTPLAYIVYYKSIQWGFTLPSYKYPQLNNREWLHKCYVEQKLSTIEISKLIGVKTCNSVRQALIRNGIPVRSVSDGITIKNPDFFVLDQEVIDGCLLGDGYMVRWNRLSDKSYPFFAKKNIYEDHVSYVASLCFTSNPHKNYKRVEAINSFNGQPCHYYLLKTQAHKELLENYERWYPKNNNFVKIVPRDINLTPVALLHWFLDDGSAFFIKNKKYIIVKFCSMGFTVEDQEFLCRELKRIFGIRASLYKSLHNGTGYYIQLVPTHAEKFYSIVGKCPVKSFDYKWKSLI